MVMLQLLLLLLVMTKTMMRMAMASSLALVLLVWRNKTATELMAGGRCAPVHCAGILGHLSFHKRIGQLGHYCNFGHLAPLAVPLGHLAILVVLPHVPPRLP